MALGSPRRTLRRTSSETQFKSKLASWQPVGHAGAPIPQPDFRPYLVSSLTNRKSPDSAVTAASSLSLGRSRSASPADWLPDGERCRVDVSSLDWLGLDPPWRRLHFLQEQLTPVLSARLSPRLTSRSCSPNAASPRLVSPRASPRAPPPTAVRESRCRGRRAGSASADRHCSPQPGPRSKERRRRDEVPSGSIGSACRARGAGSAKGRADSPSRQKRQPLSGHTGAQTQSWQDLPKTVSTLSSSPPRPPLPTRRRRSAAWPDPKEVVAKVELEFDRRYAQKAAGHAGSPIGSASVPSRPARGARPARLTVPARLLVQLVGRGPPASSPKGAKARPDQARAAEPRAGRPPAVPASGHLTQWAGELQAAPGALEKRTPDRPGQERAEPGGDSEEEGALGCGAALSPRRTVSSGTSPSKSPARSPIRSGPGTARLGPGVAVLGEALCGGLADVSLRARSHERLEGGSAKLPEPAHPGLRLHALGVALAPEASTWQAERFRLRSHSCNGTAAESTPRSPRAAQLRVPCAAAPEPRAIEVPAELIVPLSSHPATPTLQSRLAGVALGPVWPRTEPATQQPSLAKSAAAAAAAAGPQRARTQAGSGPVASRAPATATSSHVLRRQPPQMVRPRQDDRQAWGSAGQLKARSQASPPSGSPQRRSSAQELRGRSPEERRQAQPQQSGGVAPGKSRRWSVGSERPPPRACLAASQAMDLAMKGCGSKRNSLGSASTNSGPTLSQQSLSYSAEAQMAVPPSPGSSRKSTPSCESLSPPEPHPRARLLTFPQTHWRQAYTLPATPLAFEPQALTGHGQRLMRAPVASV